MRRCPDCSRATLPVKALLFDDARCARCGSVIGIHRLAATGFSIIIFIATVSTTVMVFAQMGLYAALLWFSCPIGALGYAKARLSPLEAKRQTSPT